MIIPTVMSWSSPHTVERAHARKGKKKDLQTWGWSGGGRKVRASRQHCARFRRGGAVSRHRGLCLETEGSGGGDRKNSRCTGSPRASGNRRPRGAPSAPSRPLESGTRPPRRAAEQSPGPSSSRRDRRSDSFTSSRSRTRTHARSPQLAAGALRGSDAPARFDRSLPVLLSPPAPLERAGRFWSQVSPSPRQPNGYQPLSRASRSPRDFSGKV